MVNLCQVASGRTKTSDTGEKSAATPPGSKVDNADGLYHLSPFQLDVKKKKDDEDDLRKSPALTTLLTELSTVHSPRIQVFFCLIHINIPTQWQNSKIVADLLCDLSKLVREGH